MLRLLIRFIGLLALAGGFIGCIVDGTRSIAGDGLYVTTLAQSLQAVNRVAYAAFQAFVQTHFPAFLWDPVLVHLMLVPFSLALGGIGAILILLSHEPRPGIGYSRE